MSQSLTIRHEREPNAYTGTPDTHQDTFSTTCLGFWVYLMTDCILFCTLFLTYAVFHSKTFGGATSKDLFSLSTALSETVILLVSSVTSGFAMIAASHNKKSHIFLWLCTTFLLGFSFICLEVHEFYEFVQQGHSWTNSAFLSSFFTLVGTHGLHISIGLLWIFVLLGQFGAQGINRNTFRRLAVFTLFWHFLDLIWIFIFTIVYLLGVI